MGVYETRRAALAPPTKDGAERAGGGPRQQRRPGFLDFNQIGVLHPVEALRGVRQFFRPLQYAAAGDPDQLLLIGDAGQRRILVDSLAQFARGLERLYAVPRAPASTKCS